MSADLLEDRRIGRVCREGLIGFEDDAYRISKFEVQPPSENSFLPPWLVTEVTVAAGAWVSVAVPRDLLGRLPALLAAAGQRAVAWGS